MPKSLRLQDTTGQSDDINLKEIPTGNQTSKNQYTTMDLFTRATNDCPLITLLADGPNKENIPISGAVPEIQNKVHLRQGDSSKGRETFLKIIIFKQGAF